jgi:hypothetical protein
MKGQSREASNIGTQDEEKQNTTQYMLDTTIHNQTQGKDEPNIVLCACRMSCHIWLVLNTRNKKESFNCGDFTTTCIGQKHLYNRRTIISRLFRSHT